MLYLLLLFGNKPIELPIYRPLQARHVTISPMGAAYVLDRDASRILPYSSEGLSLSPFAREGDGPGELRYPYSIAWVEDHLVIQDQHGLNLFTSDGRFVRRLPGNQEMLAKTQKGMIGAGYTFANRYLPDQVGVFSYDSLEQRQKLFVVPRAKHGTMTETYRDEGTVYFVPASARMWMVSSEDGSRVFYFPGGGQNIHVIDGSTHQVWDPIRLPRSPRVNKTWAERAYQAHLAKVSGKLSFDVKLTIPDRYPAIRTMKLLGGTLYVVLWSRAPEHNFPVLAFTLDGKPTRPRYAGHQVPQIVGIIENRVWASGWDTTKETASIALLDHATLDEFISANASPRSDWKQ